MTSINPDDPSSVPVAADPGNPAAVAEIGDSLLDLRKGHVGWLRRCPPDVSPDCS